MRTDLFFNALLMTLLIAIPGASNADPSSESDRTVLLAEEFGVVADGKTDDGDAIRRMIAHAKDVGGAAELRFPSERVLCVRSAAERYVFPLSDIADLHINGQGSEFHLAANLRFLRAERCSGLVVENLQVDFLTQPTTPGTITQVDAQTKAIEIRLDHPEMAARLGGPTEQDGEQAFFGMVALDGLYNTQKLFHYYVDDVVMESPGVVRVFNQKPVWQTLTRHVRPGHTRVGLPVPGIAHRHGPGALFVIDGCRNATVSNVDVWSAPWFSFQLFRNEGKVTFRHVSVRPKPGSRKVLSSCRDAIHAKGNRAILLFEDCVLEGLGDDAFNISTHCSRVQAIESPTRITVAQQFPLQHIPFRVGDTLILMDPETNRKIAERKILQVEENSSKREQRPGHLSPWAPSSILTLDRSLGDLARTGLVAWSRENANPETVIRRCVIRRSCRLQTSVVVEECDVHALLWFYGATIEGPGPESLVVRNSRVWANGLTPRQANAVIISGWEGSRRQSVPSRIDAVLQRVEIIDNDIRGRVRIAHALEVEATGNRITTPDTDLITFERCSRIHQE